MTPNGDHGRQASTDAGSCDLAPLHPGKSACAVVANNAVRPLDRVQRYGCVNSVPERRPPIDQSPKNRPRTVLSQETDRSCRIRRSVVHPPNQKRSTAYPSKGWRRRVSVRRWRQRWLMMTLSRASPGATLNKEDCHARKAWRRVATNEHCSFPHVVSPRGLHRACRPWRQAL